ncbi:MAG: type VI secretion system tip protein VgrG [Leptothrix sp. (in: Bacteria)]|nr:type VI secretion system tip protein VgrG [Leptothrix sp. (in: b-proteobacteria)]
MAEAPKMQMALVTSLGDKLKFRRMAAQEEISRLFEFQVVALSESPDVAADDLLGKEVGVSLQVGEQTQRWFQGVVAAFGIDGVDGRHVSYRLTLRPWLWLATRAANVRIFQEKTAPEIIKEVLGAYTGTLVNELEATYGTRTYCVQYRETDFNFVSRLMEEEGIFYFFRHSQGKHELVLADKAGSHQPFAGFATIPFDDDEAHIVGEPAISRWHMRHEIQTGKVTLRDYNFETPTTDLTSTTAASSRGHAESKREVYDYPGLYGKKAPGDALAGVRLDEAESRFARFSGQGNTQGLVAGAKFTLAQHPRTDQNTDYVVLSTEIEMQQAGYEAGAGGDTLFGCRFTAQKYAEPFRPARIMRKPAVAGPQTAVVVGEGGEGDIHADKYGRVKVHFHWDRLGKKDATSSCWVRVASPWAGHGWGMISLPRIGQEVVVDFLEGDPDQPLITGRVHNASQMPPYALPDNATVSTIKSRSKKGAAADFNELRFEDKAGSEYMLLHAQKDRFEFVEGTLKSMIGIGDGVGDEHRTVKKDRKEKIGGEHHLTVTKDVKHKFDAKLNTTVKEDILVNGGGLYSLKTSKDITAQSGAAISMKSTGDLHLKIGANIGADAAQNVHIKGGMNIVIEGGMQVTIKAGGSSVVLGPDGVSITGAMVKINSGGGPGSGAGASPVAPTDPAAPTDPEAPEDPLSHR